MQEDKVRVQVTAGVEPDGSPYVQVGKARFSQYRKFTKIGEFINAIDEKPVVKYDNTFELIDNDPFGLLNPNPAPKIEGYDKLNFKHAFYKKAGDELGCSAKVLMNHVNKLMYKVFVSDLNQKHVKSFGINPVNKQLIGFYIDKVRKHHELLNQVEKDGIYNIAPFVLHYGMQPQQLKEKFGKGAWKRLCKNSFHKNSLLINKPTCWSDVPSSLLKNVDTSYILQIHETRYTKLFEWLKLHFKGSWGNKKVISRASDIFLDTLRMASDLDENVSVKWNPEKIKKCHDEFAKRISRAQFSDKKFNWVDDFKVQEFTFGSFTATLLTSAAQIAEEGDAMSHCVGSYASYSKEGSYLVYSVKKDGERYSTIGLNVNPSTKDVSFNQQYMRFNQVVDNEDAKVLAYQLVELINKSTKL